MRAKDAVYVGADAAIIGSGTLTSGSSLIDIDLVLICTRSILVP